MKLGKKECAYCKQYNSKVLITRNKDDQVEKCKTAIYDPETQNDFENPTVKAEILKKISFYCVFCQGGDFAKKFPTMESLSSHYER